MLWVIVSTVLNAITLVSAVVSFLDPTQAWAYNFCTFAAICCVFTIITYFMDEDEVRKIATKEPLMCPPVFVYLCDLTLGVSLAFQGRLAWATIVLISVGAYKRYVDLHRQG